MISTTFYLVGFRVHLYFPFELIQNVLIYTGSDQRTTRAPSISSLAMTDSACHSGCTAMADTTVSTVQTSIIANKQLLHLCPSLRTQLRHHTPLSNHTSLPGRSHLHRDRQSVVCLLPLLPHRVH